MNIKPAVSPRVRVACALAQALLADLGVRWKHTVAVARRAEEIATTLPPEDRDVLVSAAWLHDIGYSPRLSRTGLHALDGARHLGGQGWPRRLCALVAHHSGAVFVADELGLRADLAEFDREESPVADALTYADQTVGSDGQQLPIRERMAEMLARHGDSSVQARVHHLRGPYLLAVAARVEERIRQSGA